MSQNNGVLAASTPHPARDNTTYSGNRADGNSTNFYGNVYGGLQLPDRPREASDPSPHQCLRDLRVTDPREDKARIEGDKDRLLRHCYAWILDDVSFQRWKMQHESRLLWIKGDPGKGKTMMTMGVVDELSQSRPSHEALLEAPVLSDNPTPLVSFFFCQNTVPALNNAVSVLRGLIYMLVKQRDSLLQYVQGSSCSTVTTLSTRCEVSCRICSTTPLCRRRTCLSMRSTSARLACPSCCASSPTIASRGGRESSGW